VTGAPDPTDAKLRLSVWHRARVLGSALAISFVVTPEDIESGRIILSPTCPTKRYLGFECLTCGMTRAFTALGHGRFGDALSYNKLSPVAWALVWIGFVLAARSAFCAARDWRRGIS
jgi:hypothetical protein